VTSCDRVSCDVVSYDVATYDMASYDVVSIVCPALGGGGGAGAMGAAAEGLGLLCRGLGAAVATDGPGAGAWRTEIVREGTVALSAAAASLDVPGGGQYSGISVTLPAGDVTAAAVGVALGMTLAAAGADAAEAVGRASAAVGHPPPGRVVGTSTYCLQRHRHPL